MSVVRANLSPAAVKSFVMERVWSEDLQSVAWPRRIMLLGLRLVFVVARDIAEGLLALRAMSLVYTTLLSLVPLLAVSFSVLKAFGVQNQLKPMMLGFLEPMGERGVEITEQVIGFVENVNAGVLGSVGLAVLFYTVVSLLQKVERSFNFAWRVTEHRGFARRFSDYLTIVLVGPVLIFSALGITGSMMNSALINELATVVLLGPVIDSVGRLVPYLLIIAAFSIAYLIIPNTRVNVIPALIGGTIAGVLWQSAGWVFASFIANSGNYTAIYSAFASLILFMIWLYVAWLILLVGANVAFYSQHPEHMLPTGRDATLSIRMREYLALRIMQRIAQRLYHGQPPLALAQLTAEIRVPANSIQEVVGALRQAGLITATAAEPPCYLPARALEETAVVDVLRSIRAASETDFLDARRLPTRGVIHQLLMRLDDTAAQALQGYTVKDLAMDADLPVDASPEQSPDDPMELADGEARSA
ncbi:MAG: YihY family inner membrane protein [Gammaproteobacteria bacterium]|nr:YihY family inner membrane protein [Gammaproteobacteria bacterium]NNM00756.1 YihY family inner membrane protein [Gammaproteobacteria bacterium]